MSKISLDELKVYLKIIGDEQNDGYYNQEEDHICADRLLLRYIDDEEVTELFDKLKKWYA